MNRGRVKLFKPNLQVNQTYHQYNFLQKKKNNQIKKNIYWLFYSGLAPYTGHAPLGFMSALETCQSLIGGGTTSTLT
jgi:hypothetical protein